MDYEGRLLEAIDRDLDDPARWPAPVEFRDSLALCALNAAYSLRSHSTVGKNVVARYRAWRPSADRDSGPDLIATMDEAGGPASFARDVLRYPKSKLPNSSNLCTAGIYEALRLLAHLDSPVETTNDLRERAAERAVERAWCSVNGLGPASWSFLLMNAGVECHTKVDAMVRRFVAKAVGAENELSGVRIHQLIHAAARERNVTPRQLDRAIWSHESPTMSAKSSASG